MSINFNNITFDNIDVHENKKVFKQIRRLYTKIIKNKKVIKEFNKYKKKGE